MEFIYIHPRDATDKRCWFGGLVRCQKTASDNLHNHKFYAANKIAQCVKERIGAAISANPALTPTDVACGKGIGFIPRKLKVSLVLISL